MVHEEKLVSQADSVDVACGVPGQHAVVEGLPGALIIGLIKTFLQRALCVLVFQRHILGVPGSGAEDILSETTDYDLLIRRGQRLAIIVPSIWYWHTPS